MNRSSRTADLLRAIVHRASVLVPAEPEPSGVPTHDDGIAFVPEAHAVRIGPAVVRRGATVQTVHNVGYRYLPPSPS